MQEDDPTCVARIRKVNYDGDNQARYCSPVFNCLTSERCKTICRTLSIVLLPALILFGGITVFISGCLINIPPMIIGGAAMFVMGILFCLLCGHACNGLTKRVRKPRHSRDETKPVLVWFQLTGIFFVMWWHHLKWRALQTQQQSSQWSSTVSVSSVTCCRAPFSCSVFQRYVATHQLHVHSENDFQAQVIQMVKTRKRQQCTVLIRNILTSHSRSLVI